MKNKIIFVFCIFMILFSCGVAFCGMIEDKIEIDNIFSSLLVNDEKEAKSEFTMVAPEVLTKEALKFTFNEVHGKVNSYKIYIKKNVSREEITQVVDKIDCKNITDKINGTTKEDCATTYKTIITSIIEPQWIIVDSIPIGSNDYKIEADIQMTSWEENGVMKTGYAIDWIPELTSSKDEVFKQTKWAWWNVSYKYKFVVNTSLLFPGLFYINGSSGVSINGAVIYPFAEFLSGNISLFYNNVTDYVIVENDSFIQTINYVRYSTLKGYYRVDESSGDLVDLLSKTTLTQTGTVLSDLGIFNRSRGNFSLSNYFSKDNSISWTAVNSSAVSLWVKFHSTPTGSQTLFWAGDVGGTSTYHFRQYLFYNSATSRFEFNVGKNGGSEAISYFTITPTLNQWYHIIGRYNGNNTIDIFVNGVKGLTTTNPDTGVVADAYSVGESAYNLPGSSVPLSKGYIDDVRVYESLLSDVQISSLYNSYNNTKGYGDVYAIEQQGGSNPITINSVDITAQYLDGTNTTDLAYWNAQNLTCTVDVTGNATMPYIQWAKNSNILNLNNGLVAWYRLNNETGENQTRVYDWSGNGNNGTVVNATYATNGKINGGYEFNAVNSYIATKSLNYYNYTVCAWANHTNDLNKTSMFAYSGSPNTRFHHNTDTIQLVVYNSTGSIILSNIAQSVSNNSWNYVCYGSNMTAGFTCVNSVCVYGTYNNIYESRNGVLNIGQGVGSARFFNGTIDEVRIYNRSLSAQEILDIYNLDKNTYNDTLSVGDNVSCQATTYNGTNSATSRRNITILGAEILSVSLSNTSNYVFNNTMSCYYTSNHTNNATVYWYKDGAYLYEGGSYLGNSGTDTFNNSYMTNDTFFCFVQVFPYYNLTFSSLMSNSVSGLIMPSITSQTISPTNLYWNMNASCSATINYANNVRYNWYVNNVNVLNNTQNITNDKYSINNVLNCSINASTNGTSVISNVGTTILSGNLSDFTMTAFFNTTTIFNYTINYTLNHINLINRWWYVNGTNVLNDTDSINTSFLINNEGEQLYFRMQIENGTGRYYNFSLETNITHPLNLFNQSWLIVPTGVNGTNNNFTVYSYLVTQFKADFQTSANVTNNEVWYQWFLNGISLIKGWGLNIINVFFETSDLGDNVVSVNASLSENGSNNVWSNTLAWYVNVTQPTLEPSELQPGDGAEVYDSINTYCRHNYTGHIWLYNIDIYILLKNGSKDWQTLSESTPNDYNLFDLTPYANEDNNVSLRCRTNNEYYGYSNYIYTTGIKKMSKNEVKLFRLIPSTIFIGNVKNFKTVCDMSNNDKYLILYHYADINGDGTYDKLEEYTEATSQNNSTFIFATQFMIEGQQKISVGCIIKRKTTEKWDNSNCNENEDTCTIQNTYTVEVFQ